MATPGKFWTEPVTRKRKGEAAKRLGETYTFWRAYWIDQTGTERSKDGRKSKWRKADAEKYARDMAGLVHGGTYVADRDSATVADALAIKLAECEKRNLKPIELKMSGSALRGWRQVGARIKERFGKLMVSQVSANDVEQWAQDLFVVDGLGPTMIGKMVNHLKVVMDVSVKKGWLPNNPLRGRKLALPMKVDSERYVPTDAEMVTILKAMAYRPSGTPENVFNSLRTLVYLVAFAGLRPNEACALQWSNIDWDKWEIQVRFGLTRDEGLKEVPKTRRGKREIDLMPILIAELKDYEAKVAGLEPTRGRLKSRDAILSARDCTGFVIRNRDGNPMFPADAQDNFRVIVSRAGIDNPKLTLYTLRHYAGSVWIRDAVSLHKVSRMMGHSNTAFTEKVYIHLIREMDRVRLQEMKRVSDAVRARYAELGLALPSTPLPELPAPMLAIAPPAQDDLIAASELAPARPQEEAAVLATPILTATALREAQRAKIFELYDAGMHPEDIARKYRISSESVRNWLDDRATKLLPARGRWDMSPTERQILQGSARELAAQGLSVREAGRSLGVRVATLRRWAQLDGYKFVRKRTLYLPGKGETHIDPVALKAERLAKARPLAAEGRGVSEIARRLGVPHQYVTRWCRAGELQIGDKSS
jgi:integrase